MHKKKHGFATRFAFVVSTVYQFIFHSTKNNYVAIDTAIINYIIVEY